MRMVAAARSHRRALRPEAVVVASGVVGFGVQAVAGWPGWLGPDGLAMWSEATSGGISDGHPPMLTWLFSWLQPEAHGPLLPFLVQLQLFWVGVTLAALSLQPGPRWTRFLPVLMLVNPAAWTMLIVGPQAALASVAAVTLGVAALAVRALRSGNLAGGRAAVWVAAVLAGSSAAVSRHFLPLALLLIAAIAVAVLPRQLGRRPRNEIAAKAVLITLASAVLLAVSAPAVVIGDVVSTRADESSFALDAYHADCAGFWSQGQRPSEPSSPDGLWRTAGAPCEQGGPGDYGDQWTGFTDPTGAQVLGLGDWFGIVTAHPGLVIGGRIQQLAALITEPVAALPAIDGSELVAAPGAGGQGEAIGQPNRGGLVLAVAAAVTAVVPAMALLWIVALPLAAGLWVRRQRRGEPRSVLLWPLLMLPAVLSGALALMAPTTGTAALAPGAVLGGLIAGWVAGYGSLRIGSFAAWERGPLPTAGDYPAASPSRPPPRRRLRRAVRVRRRPEQSEQSDQSEQHTPAERSKPPKHARPPVRVRRTSASEQPDLGPGSLSAFVAEIDLRDPQRQREASDTDR